MKTFSYFSSPSPPYSFSLFSTVDVLYLVLPPFFPSFHFSSLPFLKSRFFFLSLQVSPFKIPCRRRFIFVSTPRVFLSLFFSFFQARDDNGDARCCDLDRENGRRNFKANHPRASVNVSMIDRSLKIIQSIYILGWQLSNCGFFLENQRQFFHGTK